MSQGNHLVFCSIDDLRRQRKITKWVEELRDELTALSLPDGEIIVTSSICLHMGGEFEVDWNTQQLRCRWHDWRFDIKTGECLSYSLPGRRLQHYPFEQREGRLEVILPEEAV